MSVTTPNTTSSQPTFVAPHPGSPKMPPWDTGELPEPPRVYLAQLGVAGRPGAGDGRRGDRRRRVDRRSAHVTARYGGAILWLATFASCSRSSTTWRSAATRSTAASRFSPASSAFCPGRVFWLGVYLILDFGSFFPYLVANAATPLAAMILGRHSRPRTARNGAVPRHRR